MYTFFIIMTMLLNVISNVMVYKKVEDEGYVYKSSSDIFSLGSLFSIIILFVPFVNLGISCMNLALAMVVVKNDELWNEFAKKYRYLPSWVIKRFNLEHISNETFNDTLKLDGVRGLEKARVLTKAALVSSGLVREDKRIPSSLDKPKFSENDYNKAQTMIAAEQMLYEVECNVFLDRKQKEKLLKLFKKAYLREFKYPEIEYSTEDYIPEEVEVELVAIGDNNNLVEVEKELEDTLENNPLYQKILKIVK